MFNFQSVSQKFKEVFKDFEAHCERFEKNEDFIKALDERLKIIEEKFNSVNEVKKEEVMVTPTPTQPWTFPANIQDVTK